MPLQDGILISARLVTADRELVLAPNPDIFVKMLDVGDPETRDVMNYRPYFHGAVDETQLLGVRAVTIGVRTLDFGLLDQLNFFRNPGEWTTLFYRIQNQEQERMIVMRGQAASAPFTMDSRTHVDWVGSWIAPDPRIYSSEITTLKATPTDQTPGRTYPFYDPNEATPGDPEGREYPRVYPTSVGANTVIANNRGDFHVEPVVRIFGPCSNPRIANETQSKALVFQNLDITDRDYLEIRFSDRTVRLNSNPDLNRYHHIDNTVTEWWTIGPGKNNIRFNPTGFSSPSSAEITFRSAFH